MSEPLIVIGREEVARHLPIERCIATVREAMVALSQGVTRQIPRQILHGEDGRSFGVMPGTLGQNATFGAKVVSVYPQNSSAGLHTHQGLVLLFDPESGAPSCIADAGEITAIRTAAASAVATDALARTDAASLTIFGTGEQSVRHAAAIAHVRKLREVYIWGRSLDRAQSVAAEVAALLGITAKAIADPREAAARADIICTVTAAREPVLQGAWVQPGTHVNAVGSSFAGPREIDDDLVVRSRMFADHRASVLLQGAEFLWAAQQGLIFDAHVLGEIGEVIAGRLGGRTTETDVTLYKSLGVIAQDLASATTLMVDAKAQGFGTRVSMA
jgi:ornithine cyclodeaminase/alanine dehydrogenase-like protein (mu-crystallin family)